MADAKRIRSLPVLVTSIKWKLSLFYDLIKGHENLTGPVARGLRIV